MLLLLCRQNRDGWEGQQVCPLVYCVLPARVHMCALLHERTGKGFRLFAGNRVFRKQFLVPWLPCPPPPPVSWGLVPLHSFVCSLLRMLVPHQLEASDPEEDLMEEEWELLSSACMIRQAASYVFNPSTLRDDHRTVLWPPDLSSSSAPGKRPRYPPPPLV